MTLKDRIRTAREYAGFTQKELADRVDISQTAIHKLECGRSRSSRRTVAIALACGVNPIWLETGEGDMILGGSRGAHQASDIGAPYYTGAMDFLQAPVISWGDAKFWPDDKESMETDTPLGHAPVPHFASNRSFALKVQGDSMSTEFSEGDIIVVDPEMEPKNNHYVVVFLPMENDVTFKQLAVDGGRRYLKPVNPRYPIMPMEEAAKICGVVVSKYKEYE
ncbi:phage repressor protein, Serine peptidase, MEROPS family S24 [Magnetococcus marinus MC-1]|uniref:Phage repressor protein, Serine peptidase, MEROPS family S24 n=1 Tax=Magnetococcus marinus (strain ATCC BAA-1437 / JCM 17883 / MC-1) TaxID=156889 RepID=A0L7R6_MAGMM|nr:LexA family transcriptional regulator [Magnetococcus marinus]ABK44009.1 phage repressor protein, Serine peptidase, MEROPS family S24 [Magnetococcus marinus MC-1]